MIWVVRTDCNCTDLNTPLEHVKEALRTAGVKVTHQRLEVFREVAGVSDHPDVETVFQGVRQRLPTISLDTVYRTLALFTELGLLTTLGSARDRYRFDANLEPHHHFVCTRCGFTADFCSEEFNRLSIPDAAKAFGQVGKAQVEVKGICRQCMEKSPPSAQPEAARQAAAGLELPLALQTTT